jgi:hypothetical protein
LGAEAVAELLGRTVESVRGQAKRQRISLRRNGEWRGRLMDSPAEPNGQAPLFTRLRADARVGRADLRRVARRAELLARGTDLCPHCAFRPIEVDWLGTCSDCRYRQLARAHAMEPAAIAAKREWDRERQRKHRAQKNP